YDFVEVMACPGGCVGGGGQPIHEGRECAAERELILRDIDTNSKLRFSHENPSVVECYEKYFGEPNSEKAEQLLHSDHFVWGMPAARQQ
ncbi:MAG: iron hydrogenase small subunit, partial [Eggerthellaceae bacterium]|nr:iron hydrogenase small subunit [Eggerthellaceae bacterium]